MLSYRNWGRTGLAVLMVVALLSAGVAWAAKPVKPPPEPEPPFTYSVIWLDPLSGHDSTYVEGMNNNGTVVGRSFVEGVEESNRGFVSYVNTSGVRVMEDLNTLLDDPDIVSDFGNGYVIASGTDINDDGQIVGGIWIPSFGWESMRAYRYTPASNNAAFPVLEDLGLLDADTGVYSYARGINDSGMVMGTAVNIGTGTRGFYYSDADGQGMRDIGDVGGDYVYPQSINNLGQVVGYDWVDIRGDVGFIYTVADGISKVSTDTAYAMELNSINNDGVAVGDGRFTYTSRKRTTTISSAAQFDSTNNQLEDIGTQLGLSGGVAYGINIHGDIVGADDYGREWLYMEEFGVLSLDALTAGELGDFWSVRKINDDLEIIGNEQLTNCGFLLTPN